MNIPVGLLEDLFMAASMRHRRGKISPGMCRCGLPSIDCHELKFIEQIERVRNGQVS